MCAVPPNSKSPQRDTIVNYTHADLQLRDEVLAFSSKRKSRVDPGIELVVYCIFFLDDNKNHSSENFAHV